MALKLHPNVKIAPWTSNSAAGDFATPEKLREASDGHFIRTVKNDPSELSERVKNQPEIIDMMGSSFGDTLIIFSSAVCLHHVFRHFSSSSIVSVSV